MADSTVNLNPGAGGDSLDAESLTVGGTPVKRERVQIAGATATAVADVDATTRQLKAGDFRPLSFESAVGVNSSDTTLGANGVFTGTGEDMFALGAVACTVNLDGGPQICPGTLYFEFSHDNTNWAVSVPLVVSDLSVVIPFPLRGIRRYFRVRYVNGTTAQTSFHLKTVYHRTHPGDLIRTPTQPIGPSEPMQVVRALVEPGLSFGQRRILGADRDVFGAAITHSRINQVEADFSKSLANNDVTTTITGAGGTATQASGEATVNTGTGVLATTARIETNKITRYSPYREIFTAFTARFSTPSATAGEHQRIGLFDNNNGVFIGYQGNSFGFTVRKNAVDTFTALTSANGDPLNGTFLSRFSRLNHVEALDPTKTNVWRIRLGWLGGSVIHFEIQSPDGEWMTVHTLLYPNSSTGPHILSVNLPMRMEVIKNAADATGLTIGSSSWAAGIVADPYGSEPFDVRSREEVQANAVLTGIALVGVGVAVYTVPAGRRFRLTDLTVSYDSNQNSAAELQLRDASAFNTGNLIWRIPISGSGSHEVIPHQFKSPPGFTTQVELAISATHAGTLTAVNISGYSESI